MLEAPVSLSQLSSRAFRFQSASLLAASLLSPSHSSRQNTPRFNSTLLHLLLLWTIFLYVLSSSFNPIPLPRHRFPSCSSCLTLIARRCMGCKIHLTLLLVNACIAHLPTPLHPLPLSVSTCIATSAGWLRLFLLGPQRAFNTLAYPSCYLTFFSPSPAVTSAPHPPSQSAPCYLRNTINRISSVSLFHYPHNTLFSSPSSIFGLLIC